MRRPFVLMPLLTLFSAGAFCDTLTVDAMSDIYSAGHASLPTTPYPGTFAPGVILTAGPNQVLRFSSVTGMVGCNFVITNGPDGTCASGVSTTLTSYAGLSGISANKENMFLVGVFLDNTEPAGTGPSVLSYDYGTADSLGTTDGSYSPSLDQVFFVGDGLTGTGAGATQDFYVPSTATRFYLGFADSFDSAPSYYGDDLGSLTATFSITSAPEPTMFLPAGLAIGLGVWRRSRKKA